MKSPICLIGVALSVAMAAAQAPVPSDPSKSNDPNAPATAPVSTPAPATTTAPAAQALAAKSSSTDTPAVKELPSTKAVQNIDDLLAPPPMPKGKVALIGGTVKSLDPIRNRMTMQIYGKGGEMKVFFDEPSRIYRNGKQTTILGVHKGDRIYVDTQ